MRDFFYAVLFVTLPLLAWQGAWTGVLLGILAAEILLTLTDFAIEGRARRKFGDVFAGERVTHAVMGIIYGAMIVCLIPTLLHWWSLPTALQPGSSPLPTWLVTALVLMGVGVFLSGIRDLLAAWGGAWAAWPWRVNRL